MLMRTDETFHTIGCIEKKQDSAPRRAEKAQYDRRPARLVDGLESRACLSTILSFAFHLEDSEKLLKRLCKKGSAFLEKDEGTLKGLSVKKADAKPASPVLRHHTSGMSTA